MDKGYILLSRNLLDSDVFASQKLLKIWIWCLCKANFKDRAIPLKIGKGEIVVKVDRGSFIFGRHKAEEELFIDGSTIYKSINKLKEMGMIDIKSNNQYSIVTINKYDTYQDNENYKVTTKEQPKNNQRTSEEQPSNTTNTLTNDTNDTNKLKEDIFLSEILKDTKPKIPFEEIVDIFHSVCFELPKLRTLEEKRKKSISKIIKDYSLEELGNVFKKVNESDFLSGRKTEWKANFDWIMNPTNFLKILEDNYKNNNNGQQVTEIGESIRQINSDK